MFKRHTVVAFVGTFVWTLVVLFSAGIMKDAEGFSNPCLYWDNGVYIAACPAK